jgi:hypothetical protein
MDEQPQMTPEQQQEVNEFYQYREMKGQILNKEQQMLNARLERLREFNNYRIQLIQKEGRILGKLHALRKFPYPKQLMSLYLVAILGLGTLFIAPYAAVALMGVMGQLPDAFMQYMSWSMALMSVFTFLLGLYFIKTRKIGLKWMKAQRKNFPIVALGTKNKFLEFIVPEERLESVYTLNDQLSMLPDPEAALNSYHNVQVLPAIPEIGIALDIRGLAHNHNVNNIDMTSIRQYAELFAARERSLARGVLNSILPILPYLLIVVIMGLLFLPIAWKGIDQQSTIDSLNKRASLYHQQLYDNHIKPFDEANQNVTFVSPGAGQTVNNAPPTTLRPQQQKSPGAPTEPADTGNAVTNAMGLHFQQ